MLMASDRPKPDVNADEGTKDSTRREDVSRFPFRPSRILPSIAEVIELI